MRGKPKANRHVQVTLVCPACGRKVEKTLGWIEDHRDLACRFCHAAIDLEPARHDLALADQAVMNLVADTDIHLVERMKRDQEEALLRWKEADDRDT